MFNIFIILYTLIVLLAGRETFELVSGVHQFPFAFALPKKIPSSFQTEMLEKFGYGHVKYSIKVVLKRSSRQANGETCYIPFTVSLLFKNYFGMSRKYHKK
jgi:hypothetical protein